MRRACLGGATALCAGAAALAPFGMTGHMAAHMIAVAVAAPLFGMGLRGTAADPVRLGGPFANPLALSVAELAVVWLWHLPGARAAVGHDGSLAAAELACFLVVGTLLWSAVLAARPASNAAGVGALLLTSMHMTLLGALIGLAPRLLYPDPAHHGALGLSPMQDQQLAGVVMLMVGGVSYLAGGLAVLARLLKAEARPA
ncbi:cytochrome c oxidase assembly protein [uncultured Sphingomonas sp.]|uniref:cytochrome c oxidase assembly protein n=1 Tax=uncultured Sphingomonas sp. TaxID=158754 RepID=UPI0025E63930|nr:cytochrome c oxidase assembly protein [uncultured Sphingomonas sp.]